MMTPDDSPEIKVDDISEKAATASTATANDDDDDNASKASSSAAAKKPIESVTPSFAKILSLVKGDIHLLVISLFLIFVAEAANLAVPRIIGKAYDSLQILFYDQGAVSVEGGENSDQSLDDMTMQKVSQYFGLAIGIYSTSLVAGYIRGVMFGTVGERMVARVRKETYDSVLRQEVGFFDAHGTGEIISRLGNDTQLLQQGIGQFAPEVVRGCTTVIVALILMFTINAKLTGLAIGGMVIVCLVVVPLGKKLGAVSKEYQDILGDAQARSTEALGNIRTVISFVAEPKELSRYMEKIGDPDHTPTKCNGFPDVEQNSTYSKGVEKVIYTTAVFLMVFGGSFGFLYFTLWYGFSLLIYGELTLGELSAFQSYVFIVGGGIGGMGTNLTGLVTAVAASGRVFYLMDRKPRIKNVDGISDDDDESEEATEVKESADAKPSTEKRKSIVPANPMDGNIEFENVMFSYPTRPDILVLNAFNLKLTKNTTTALVGSSGSGKSTVVSLIQRFYDVDAGTIKLDGVDITHLDMSWLRSQIGYVQQEPSLFGVTIRENLTYGLSEADEAKITQTELENACRDANAHEFITSWEEGYDTMVGERGVTLSGGQKQRIAIARALLTNCRILLLDEATSALDSESEHEVQKAIENAMVGRTVVVVAHRLSTIQNADQIVVMDNRKIVDVGTHEDLLNGCKRYQDLIKRQSTMARDVSTGTLKKLLPPDFSIDEEE